MRDEGKLKWGRMEHPVSDTAAISGALVGLFLYVWLLLGALDAGQAIRSVGCWVVTGACVAVVVITVNAYLKPDGYWGWCVVVMTGMVGLWSTATAAFWAWKGVGLLAGAAAGVGVGGVAVLWVWVMLHAMRRERKRRMRGFEVEGGGDAPEELRLTPKWDRMKHPLSHLAAVVGCVSGLALLICLGLLDKDPRGMVASRWWLGFAGGSGGMLVVSVVAYFVPRDGSAWVLVGVVAAGMLGVLGVIVVWVWRMVDPLAGMLVAVLGGGAWVVWVGLKVGWLMAERRERQARVRGFEVGEGGMRRRG